jgi:hypothetical protein
VTCRLTVDRVVPAAHDGDWADDEPAKAYEQGWHDLIDALERGA